MGRSPSSETVRGVTFTRTSSSLSAIFAVPDGKIRFCAFTEFKTSLGETFLACIRF